MALLMKTLVADQRGCFSKFAKVTTCETKTGFLLIKVFSSLVNPQNYGHQGSILGGHSHLVN